MEIPISDIVAESFQSPFLFKLDGLCKTPRSMSTPKLVRQKRLLVFVSTRKNALKNRHIHDRHQSQCSIEVVALLLLALPPKLLSRSLILCLRASFSLFTASSSLRWYAASSYLAAATAAEKDGERAWWANESTAGLGATDCVAEADECLCDWAWF